MRPAASSGRPPGSRRRSSSARSTCDVEHFVHHARGAASSTEVEHCADDDLAAAFVASGQDLPQLVADFVRSDGFRFRDVGDAP